MKTIRTILLVIALVGAGIVITAFLIDASLYARSADSSYQYSVSISTNTTLENVTFIIPLPSHKGRSVVGEAILAGEAQGIPEDWHCSLEDREGGVMLRISTVRIVPRFQSPLYPPDRTPGPREPGDESGGEFPPGYSPPLPEELVPIRFSVSIQNEDGVIDTRYPVGNEPLLSPKLNLAPVAAGEGEGWPTPGPDGRAGTVSSYHFDCPVYAAYQADEDAVVTIRIEFTGQNSWWVGGWQWNEYRERFGITLYGTDPGWQEGQGTMRAGFGLYR